MSTSRQIWALIRRYCIRQQRSPISSSIFFILLPALWLFLFYKLIFNVVIPNRDGDNDNKNNDKSSGMKSLMISIGLKKFPYYLSNFICFTVTALPTAIFIGTISARHLFKDSIASGPIIISVFELYVIHMSGLVFVFNSLFKNPNFASLIVLGAFLESLAFHSLVKLVANKFVSATGAVLFIAMADPYESVRLFGESYAACKNNGTTSVVGNKLCASNTLILAGMAFWTLAAFLFAIWFDEACPWQTDTANRGMFWFLKSSDKDHGRTNMELPQRSTSSKYFEPTETERKVGISIEQVSKEFSGKNAINDISFKIYRGETTLLLGHNGAGKTTLMDMILGKLMPNKGRIHIDGLSASGPYIGIGVCPQTSVFDEFLSVRQHLQLISAIKSSLDSDTRKRDIDTTLADVSLIEKDDSLPTELSGGMKRKLNLGMAFVGKSSILILDEPSSGLDPDSRVFIWNAIRRHRADRTVLLSTQHMEEADYLGDRIAIMSAGKIICCGSSVFLTKLFGSGYKLRIECSSSSRKDILELARRHFSGASIADEERVLEEATRKTTIDMVVDLVGKKSDHGSKTTHEDPELSLIRLLEELENRSKDLSIKAFGLRSSSVEDVLLNTAKLVHDDAKSSVRLSIDASAGGQLKTVTNPPIQRERNCLIDQTSFFVALMKKHFSTYRADWFSILLFRVVLVGFVCWLMVKDIEKNLYLPIFTPSNATSLIIFHFLSYPVKERVSKFKIMQLNTQANEYIYWISQLVIDLLTIVVAIGFINIWLEVVIRDSLRESGLFVHLVASGAMLLFGIAGALNCYVLSMFCSNIKTALFYAILYFTIGLLVTQILIPGIIILFKMNQTIESVQKTVGMIFIIIYPTDALQYAFYGLTIAGYIKPDVGPLIPTSNTGFSPLATGFLALAGQALVFGTLLYLIEAYNLEPYMWFSYLWDSVCCACRKAPPTAPEGPIDSDVQEERNKTRAAINGQRENYKLVAHDLSKSYRAGVKVVNHLSFSVNKGECFGLLGVNGAGKSTTFSMLVGERRPDSGRLWLQGTYVDDNLSSYRKKLGYDPQENPNISLTPVEALALMARLRCVEARNIPALVDSLLVVLDMSEHANKSCDQLSGGTKRKLVLGMSLIGNMNTLALDEPTAGVDPMARRGVWQLLRSLKTQKQVSIVISSHAMEECEAICDRISIMARGHLRCIGTFLQLRTKFTQGCTVRIQFRPTGSESLNDFASKIVPELTKRLQHMAGDAVKLADLNVNSATFNMSMRDYKRSALFKLMRDFSQIHSNVTYVINDSSLEDIFLAMAREQQP